MQTSVLVQKYNNLTKDDKEKVKQYVQIYRNNLNGKGVLQTLKSNLAYGLNLHDISDYNAKEFVSHIIPKHEQVKVNKINNTNTKSKHITIYKIYQKSSKYKQKKVLLLIENFAFTNMKLKDVYPKLEYLLNIDNVTRSKFLCFLQKLGYIDNVKKAKGLKLLIQNRARDIRPTRKQVSRKTTSKMQQHINHVKETRNNQDAHSQQKIDKVIKPSNTHVLYTNINYIINILTKNGITDEALYTMYYENHYSLNKMTLFINVLCHNQVNTDTVNKLLKHIKNFHDNKVLSQRHNKVLNQKHHSFLKKVFSVFSK